MLSILTIALGLSADCFAVALSASITRKTFSLPAALRVSLSFGSFQAIMPVLGWLAGLTVIQWISDYDHWLAFALLALVGSKMIWESYHEKDGYRATMNIEKWLILLTLSLATSVDALAVGLSFAFLKVNIALASATIAMVAFTVTFVGFLMGNKVGALAGRRAETIGGAILIIIGLRILLGHIL